MEEGDAEGKGESGGEVVMIERLYHVFATTTLR